MDRNAYPDRAFAGSVPQAYDRYMVPLVFDHYARDMAARVLKRRPKDVLEIAAGTGVVTRHLASGLDAAARLVATDISAPMLQQAQSIGTSRPIEWQVADAMSLPFADQSFDVVACQFGAMMLPDKPRAFAESRRLLRPGGVLVFNVWDTLADNDFARLVTETLATVFPDDPPRFLARLPHGYADLDRIVDDLAAGGFIDPHVETLRADSRAPSADFVATAYCKGTPLRAEIEARDATRLEEATAACAAAIAARFGSGEVVAPMQAHLVEAVRWAGR